MQKYSILNRQASLTTQGPQGLQFELTLDAVDADEKAKRRKAIRRFYFFSHLRNILNKKKTLEKNLETGHLVYVGGRSREHVTHFFRFDSEDLYKKLFKDSMAFEPRH